VMRRIFKSDFVWQFVGGFALGAIALVTLHPAEAAHAATRPQIEATR
jgi:hypothetical protein